mmetsp:Transcript_17219/g.43803  ORF Transcript_17219/g.43803 Transcript_17219/m.43803 type:complete len:472 (+) Transcript_17219:1037-2452(+)
MSAFTDSIDASASAKAFLASCSSSSCALSLAPVSSNAARASRYLSTRVSNALISSRRLASAPRSPTSFLLLFRVLSRVSRAWATPLASDMADTSWLRPSRSCSLALRNCSKLTSSGEATRSADSSLIATSSSRWSSSPTPSCSSSCFLHAASAALMDSSAAALGPSPGDSTQEGSSDTQWSTRSAAIALTCGSTSAAVRCAILSRNCNFWMVGPAGFSTNKTQRTKAQVSELLVSSASARRCTDFSGLNTARTNSWISCDVLAECSVSTSCSPAAHAAALSSANSPAEIITAIRHPVITTDLGFALVNKLFSSRKPSDTTTCLTLSTPNDNQSILATNSWSPATAASWESRLMPPSAKKECRAIPKRSPSLLSRAAMTRRYSSRGPASGPTTSTRCSIAENTTRNPWCCKKYCWPSSEDLTMASSSCAAATSAGFPVASGSAPGSSTLRIIRITPSSWRRHRSSLYLSSST